VLGDAAVLVDATSEDELAQELAHVLHDDVWRASLVARGTEHAARYSWAATAERFAHLYRRVA
jgi:glycosyltransferase involved in cell wall biosynthesis